jgi:cytochrome b561
MPVSSDQPSPPRDETRLQSARLKAWQIWLLVISGGTLWLSGATWLILYYFLRTKGEFGAEIHPAEPTMMDIHGAAIPLALLALGSLLAMHIPKGWTYRHQRRVGIVMLVCFALLIITGYFLSYAADEDIRGWASTFHWVIGLGIPALFALHWSNGRSRPPPI